MPRPARSEQFDPAEVCILHVVQRCVLRAFLAGVDPVSGKDFSFRKDWIRRRMDRPVLGRPIQDPANRRRGRKVRRDGWLAPLRMKPDVLSSDAEPHRDEVRSSDKGFLNVDWTDYKRLLRWTARQGVGGITAKVPAGLARTLTEVGIEASMWRDLVSLGLGGCGLQVATTATTCLGIARRDGGTLITGHQFSKVPFMAFLSALFTFLARQLFAFRLGVGMLGARCSAEAKNCVASVSGLDQ